MSITTREEPEGGYVDIGGISIPALAGTTINGVHYVKRAQYCIRAVDGRYLTGNLNLFSGRLDMFWTPGAGLAYTYPVREDAEAIAREHGGVVTVYAPHEETRPEPRRRGESMELFS